MTTNIQEEKIKLLNTKAWICCLPYAFHADAMLILLSCTKKLCDELQGSTMCIHNVLVYIFLC